MRTSSAVSLQVASGVVNLSLTFKFKLEQEPPMSSTSVPVFKILPTTQKYDWGKTGLSSKVAQFISQPQFGVEIDEGSPYAEVFLLLC